jgi:hypothetical protein
VEWANVEILRGLKIRTYNDLEKHGAKWVDQLPSVLWGNQTTPSRATGETISFWSSGLKHAFLRRSPWAHYESKPSMRSCRSDNAAKM